MKAASAICATLTVTHTRSPSHDAAFFVVIKTGILESKGPAGYTRLVLALWGPSSLPLTASLSLRDQSGLSRFGFSYILVLAKESWMAFVAFSGVVALEAIAAA